MRRILPLAAALCVFTVVSASSDASIDAAVVGEVTDSGTSDSAAGDGTACYNGCSGHGTCRQYTCHCEPGFQGEDCSINLLPHGQRTVGLLTAGHYNLTTKSFTKQVRATKKRLSLLVVGFSSYACDKCVVAEAEYEQLSAALQAHRVPFARLNVNKRNKQLAVDEGLTSLPAVKLYKRGVGHLYTGPHTATGIMHHVRKLLGPTLPELVTPADLADVLQQTTDVFGGRPFSVAVAALGTADPEDADEFEDVDAAASKVNTRTETAMFLARGPLVAWMRHEKWLRTTHATVVLIRVGHTASGGAGRALRGDSCSAVSADGAVEADAECLLRSAAADRSVLSLPDFFGEGVSLDTWVLQQSLPPVTELTPATFPVYDALDLPMFILFLDMRGFVGGEPLTSRSGDYSNERLLQQLTAVARDFRKHIAFVYTDGVAHADRMRSLGLPAAGRDGANLPAAAFNVRDGRRLPFPHADRKLTEASMRQFCDHFLSGHLQDVRDAADGGGAGGGATASKAADAAGRQAAEEADGIVEEVKGVRERFTAADAALVPPVVTANFTDVVMDETKDVLLLFMASNDANSMAMTPYYRRLALRFHELDLSPSMVVLARVDVEQTLLPSEFSIDSLPALAFLPAYDKLPPFKFYSGVSKVAPMMQWVHEHSGLAWMLPDELPQFDEADKTLFKQQLTEREQRRQQRAKAGRSKTTKKKKKKKK